MHGERDSVEKDLSAVAAYTAGERIEQGILSLTFQCRDADNFAGMNVKGNTGNLGSNAQVMNLQEWRTRGGFGGSNRPGGGAALDRSFGGGTKHEVDNRSLTAL